MAGGSLVNPNDLGATLQALLDRVTQLEQAGGSIPVGAIIFSPVKVPFDGFLACDGSTFDGNRYGRLKLFLGGTTLPAMSGKLIANSGGVTFTTVNTTVTTVASAATLAAIVLLGQIKY